MNVMPLVWLLLFDALVCVVYTLFGWFEIKTPDKLGKVMVGLVIVINVFVLILWLLSFFGVALGDLAHGPFYRR